MEPRRTAANGRREICDGPEQAYYRKYGNRFLAILLFFGCGVIGASGQRPQLKRPEEAPTEKPAEAPKKKNVKGPRAVAVLQLNSSGKGTLVPVAILVDGKFYDASAYKADPVPMALEGGTVYEVEKCGESQGLFTVRGALHKNNPNSASPWMGSGSYVLNGAEATKSGHKAEITPRDLESDNAGPPRLTRGKEDARAASANQSATNSSGAQPQKPEGQAAGPQSESPGTSQASGSLGANETSGSQNTTNQGSASESSTKQSSAGSSANQGSAKQSSTNQTGSQAGASQNTKAAGGMPAEGSAAGVNDSQSPSTESHYQPTLRRGKPVDKPPDDSEEMTGPIQKPGDGATSNTVGGTAQAPVQLVPAISDASGPEPRSFQFYWKEGEEEDRQKQMLALAADEVRSYIHMREKETIPAKATPVKVGAKSATGSAKKETKIEPSFENVQFHAFDVWKNSQPVMILTAEARVPQTAGAHVQQTKGAENSSIVYDVTIAARTDIYGDLRKLYAGITDKFHLDVTPKLQLIDAVDADGDGRGELLFRETTDAGTGYLIYRPTGDTLWKMYDSLNQE